MMTVRTVAAMGAVLAAAIAAPALAQDASTRLVECGSANCLLVTGHRESAATRVHINGHAVTVEGGRNWRAKLPLETVRDWSAPYARSVEITLHDQATRRSVSQQADLPIGLMGHTDLASLVVRAH